MLVLVHRTTAEQRQSPLLVKLDRPLLPPRIIPAMRISQMLQQLRLPQQPPLAFPGAVLAWAVVALLDLVHHVVVAV